MKTDASVRIQDLYEQTLRPRLENLEGLRRQLRGFIIKAGLLVGIPALGIWGSEFIAGLLAPGWETAVAWISFSVLVVAIVFAAIRYFIPAFTTFANYKARFKREVVSEIFRIVCPTATYEPFKSIAADVFDASAVFNPRGSYWSDDRVRGRIGDTPFEAAEVRRTYTTGSGKNSTSHVVFEGLFFHLDFNRALNGTTLVQPESARSDQIGDRSGLRLVSLENPEFEREFKVYATNDVEARYILTPTMMEQLLAVRRRAERPVFLGFKDNGAYIGVHYGRSLFEPSIASTTSLEALEEMADHFALAEFLIQELDLNTRIWTKSVDDSLLRQQDAPQHPLQMDALTSGHLTEGDLLKVAKSLGASIGDEDDASPAPRPENSRIRVAHDGGSTTISYGVPISFFVILAISGACAGVLMSALHALGWRVGFDPVGELVARIPSLAPGANVVGEFPLPVAIGAAVVGSFLALWWATRVRKVVVGRDAIRIYRGLRLFPRRYERPAYGRVVRIEKAVYIGKQGSASLINPTASPMLRSDDEGRWVASEIRRALKETDIG